MILSHHSSLRLSSPTRSFLYTFSISPLMPFRNRRDGNEARATELARDIRNSIATVQTSRFFFVKREWLTAAKVWLVVDSVLTDWRLRRSGCAPTIARYWLARLRAMRVCATPAGACPSRTCVNAVRSRSLGKLSRGLPRRNPFIFKIVAEKATAPQKRKFEISFLERLIVHCEIYSRNLRGKNISLFSRV